ncbi:MAG: CPXCG motif-containing cysteine-rich protein [Pseudomonadales bacterium]
MWHTEAVPVGCPYCGERIEVVVDPSVNDQTYIEDCSVCCRPITLSVSVDPQGNASVEAAREDD